MFTWHLSFSHFVTVCCLLSLKLLLTVSFNVATVIATFATHFHHHRYCCHHHFYLLNFSHCGFKQPFGTNQHSKLISFKQCCACIAIYTLPIRFSFTCAHLYIHLLETINSISAVNKRTSNSGETKINHVKSMVVIYTQTLRENERARRMKRERDRACTGRNATLISL